MTATTLPGVLLPAAIHASRPSASAVAGGTLFPCTTHSLIYQSDGVSTWTTWATLGTAGAYVAGGTDVAVADGGTGSSTAAGAATNLGLGTGDSPQFTAVNIGAATDTTVTRTGAGDIAVEGNALYRAGGTDVPIADGGTGASTKAAGFDALSPMTTSGDVIYGGASGTGTRLPKGTNGDVLTLASGLPSWAAPGGGGAGTVTTVKDEGSNLSTAVTSIDFVGAGVTATGTTAVTVTIPGGSAVASAVEYVKGYTQVANNTTSSTVTITAAAVGQRIIVCVSSYQRDVNTPTCTNVTFTEVLATNFSTGVYLSCYVGVVAGSPSGTSLTITATGSNWIIADVYVVTDALTPTAGTSATLTNTDASSVASTLIGPITPSIGSFIIAAAAQNDGTIGFSAITINAGNELVKKIPSPANTGLCSAVFRSQAASISAYTTGGSSGGDFAAGIVAVS